VRRIIEMAHAVGALVYVDAVQYVPHGPTDVQAIGADFLACSAYKFFGPHVGLLYGRLDLLERLPAYKVRPAYDTPPDKFETGTQNYECQAGLMAAVDYLASIGEKEEGRRKAKEVEEAGYSLIPGRRERITRSMQRVRAYERGLCERLLDGLRAMPGVRIYGITDPARMDQRVPTVAFRLDGMTPRAVAEALGKREIYVWDGNFYALAVTSFLGLEPNGVVRVGLAHYNTAEEVDMLLYALDEIRKTHRVTL
jgi:selenocysteine lyase/cysteine desulfurase